MTGRPGSPGPHVDHERLGLAWREAGAARPDDPPVVFLHGLGGTRLSWGAQLRGLSARLDTASVRPSWENDGSVVAVADLELGGAPYEVSSRRGLQRSLAAWKELGYGVKVGIELEGYLPRPHTGRSVRQVLEPALDGLRHRPAR